MNRQNVVCFGDSITMCLGEAEANRWTACLAFLLEGRFPGEYDVFNKGVGGNTTALALDRIVTDVIALKPAIVLVEFGINDAYTYPWCRTARVGLDEYRKNIGEIVRQVREENAQVVLIINHPITLRKDQHPQGNGVAVGQNLEPYNEALRQIACKEKLPSIDLSRLLEKEKIDGFHSEDGVHLSPAGNHLYAKLVFESYFQQPPSLHSYLPAPSH
ncbi:MAG: SGNH/GDSL hydrolase family protein [Chthoniobacteraceae bacterium]